MKSNPESNNLVAKRHSLAHLLAAAVLELWPDTKPTLGPAIDNGFYYDLDFTKPITEKDSIKIEKKMRDLLPRWDTFTHQEVGATEAKKLFANNEYKNELIDEIVERGEKITLYTSGQFTDLCRGGHVESMKDIAPDSFKLDRLAGAYWRGDEKNPMLTRIYGLAFNTKSELDAYLLQREEAEKRDHKKLGKELELFVFSPLVGPGLPLFLPKGTAIRTALENFINTEKRKLGYQFVSIPHIAKAALYEKSGHLGKYDAMMPIMKDSHGNELVLKAMNCPHHFELYNALPRSYRDLPLRLAETTTVYRNEKSGELQGLTRVMSLTQDDTHHFVAEDQIESEIEMILGLMKRVYETFGFTNYRVQISVRDPKTPEKYFGDDALWQKSEQILIEAAKRWGQPYNIKPGEAAFYGPKIDVMVKDSIGREWQLTTVQLDFNQPVNFDMTYTGTNGQKHRPAVLHVAILGSVERFMGILIEHYAGAFPAWLAPVQVKILPISDKHLDYAKQIFADLKNHGARVELDDAKESLGKKIRAAKLEKIPYLVIIGDQEVASQKLTVETRDNQKLTDLSVEKFYSKHLA